MDPHRPLDPTLYQRPAGEVARDLLGHHIVRRFGDKELILRIVETEAYLGEGDRASHAHAGPTTPRARRLFREPGRAYVYLIYGMHYCLNVVTQSADDGSAVLIRGGEPVAGEDSMLVNRGWTKRARPGDVAGGPGKLCGALRVDHALDGHELWRGELMFVEGEVVPDSDVAVGPRVGVDYAGEAASWPLRFAIRGNVHVSRPRPI